MKQVSLEMVRIAARLAPIGFLALLLLAPEAPGQTITFTGDRGNSCAAIPATVGGSQVFTLTATIPAGSLVVIAAATTANATFGSVTDSGGNTYVSDNSHLGSNPYRVFAISSRLTTGLAIGNTISINYTGSAPTGETSCAVVSVFQNVTAAPARVDRTGTADGTGTNWNVSLFSATTQANELVHAAFATNQSTGGFSIPAPFQPLSAACSAPFCVFGGYRIVGATGTYTATATSVNSIAWGAVLTTDRDSTAPVMLQRFHVE
jgi:hypothetical protein